MNYKKLINKAFCIALVFTMILTTGCSNGKNTDSNIDKDLILNSIKDSSESALAEITSIEDSQVKSVTTNQNYDGTIELKNDTINFSGNGATVEGSKITIKQAGTYVVSGKLDDGQIIIDSDKNSVINLVLNGANINCSNSSAIYSKKAKETKITILADTVNKLTDGSSYEESADTDAPTACIYSQDNLTIDGTGTMGVTGNYNDAITSKDVLTINEGVMLVSSADDGIVGRDAVLIKNGDIKIISQGDGIKSTNDEDTSKGYITIDNGIFDITTGTDGIQGETDLTINDGSFNIVTGGGSENSSTKTDNMGQGNWGNWGMKPDKNNSQTPPNMPSGNSQTPPNMPSGNSQTPPNMPSGDNQAPPNMPSGNNQAPSESPNQNSDTQQQKPDQNLVQSNSQSTTDDETSSAKAIKCKNNLIINSGSFNIDSSDDSIHCNLNITINNGSINIASGDDGIHADSTVNINNGTINITKSYEGIEGEFINIASGTIDVVASDDGINISGGNDSSSVNGRPGQNNFMSTGNGKLNIAGGNITVNASGDGLDANGSIYMTDGKVIVFGPTNDGNGSLDYDGEFKVSGGTIIAAGSAGMAQAPSNTSTQCSISITLDTAVDSGKEVSLKDKDGNLIASFTTIKETQNIVFSSPDLEQISSYELYVGDELVKEFSTTGIVTNEGNRSFGGGKR